MICMELLDINLNRILLLAVGLWPYQRSKLVQLQLFLFFGILTTSILFQLTSLVTLECTSIIVIKVLSSVFFNLVFAVKYYAFLINVNFVKYVLEMLQHIYNELRDENEIAIIRNYGQIANNYITRLIILFFIGILIMLYLFRSVMLDILWPLNESRPRLIQFVTEYFVDQEKYFNLIMLHVFVALLIGGTVFLATGATLLTIFQYACGMFQVARFTDTSISKFTVPFFFLIVFGVVCSSLCFYQISEGIIAGCNIEELLIPIMFFNIHFVYLGVSNFIAQEIIDHNNHMFTTVYNIQWYVAPLKVQKMILFLLQRGNKMFAVHISVLFVGSLEGAATILSAAISYFTFLYSAQH